MMLRHVQYLELTMGVCTITYCVSQIGCSHHDSVTVPFQLPPGQLSLQVIETVRVVVEWPKETQ